MACEKIINGKIVISIRYFFGLFLLSTFLNSTSMEKPKSNELGNDLPDISLSIHDWLEREKYENRKACERHIDARIKTYNPPSLLFLAALAYKTHKRKFEEQTPENNNFKSNIKLPQDLLGYFTFMGDNQYALRNKWYGDVLLNAAQSNCITIVPDLIVLRVDLNYRKLVSKGDSDRSLDRFGKNAIKVAREHGHTQFAEFLIKMGADPEEMDEDPSEVSPLELYLRSFAGSVQTNENSRNT